MTAFFMVAPFVGAPGLALAESLTYLVVEEKSRPFQLEVGESQQGKGIISDIVEALFKESPHALLIRQYPVKRLQHQVKTGREKHWIAYEAKVWNTFPDQGRYLEVPLFTVRHALATCHSGIGDALGVNDLTGMELAVLKGFDYPEITPLAEDNKISLVDVDNYLAGFSLVSMGRISGFVEMDIRLRYNAAVIGDKTQCVRYVDLSEVIPPFDIFLQVDRNLPAPVVQDLEQRLRQMKSEGVIDRILARYTGQ